VMSSLRAETEMKKLDRRGFTLIELYAFRKVYALWLT
jgi:hypothetical protein